MKLVVLSRKAKVVSICISKHGNQVQMKFFVVKDEGRGGVFFVKRQNIPPDFRLFLFDNAPFKIF